MVPVVTVVAFTLMGIEGIAEEIEMPFGAFLDSVISSYNKSDKDPLICRQAMTILTFRLVSCSLE